MNTTEKPISYYLFESNTNSLGYSDRETCALNQIDDIMGFIPRCTSSVELSRQTKEISFGFCYPMDCEILNALLVRILQGIEPYKHKSDIFRSLVLMIMDWDSLFSILLLRDDYSDTLTHWSELRRDLSWSLIQTAGERLKKIELSRRELFAQKLFNVIKLLIINADDGFTENVASAVSILADLGSDFHQMEEQAGLFVDWLCSSYLDYVLASSGLTACLHSQNEAIALVLKKLRIRQVSLDSCYIEKSTVFSSRSVSKIKNENCKNSTRAIGTEIVAFFGREQLKKHWGDLTTDDSINTCLNIVQNLIYMKDYSEIEWIRDVFTMLLPKITRSDQMKTWTKAYKGKLIQSYYQTKGYSKEEIADRIVITSLREIFRADIDEPVNPKKKQIQEEGVRIKKSTTEKM